VILDTNGLSAMAGGDPALDEVCNAKGDDERFASAGPGEDQQRTLERLDSLPLLRIQ